MIDFGQAVWLAMVQGLTEFLPVSSSAHLVLLPILADWPDQGLAFDVAVHVGTLGAVVVYLRRDLVGIVACWSGQCGSGGKTEESRIGRLLIVATCRQWWLAFFLMKQWRCCCVIHWLLQRRQLDLRFCSGGPIGIDQR